MEAANLPEQRIARFKSCGSNAWVLQGNHDHTAYRIVADYCHDRWCIPCCRARSLDLQRAIGQFAGRQKLRFLTLTLRHSQTPLADQLRRLWTAFRKLRAYKAFRAKVSGGLAFLEVKWQPLAKRWHPHLHVLIAGAYFPQADIATLWLRATGDSHVVDIRAVSDLPEAARYVAKYASKAWDHGVLADPDALSEALRSLHGKRLWFSWGKCKVTIRELHADNADWQPVCRLCDLLNAAKRGEPAAQQLLKRLDRSPPCSQDNLGPSP